MRVGFGFEFGVCAAIFAIHFYLRLVDSLLFLIKNHYIGKYKYGWTPLHPPLARVCVCRNVAVKKVGHYVEKASDAKYFLPLFMGLSFLHKNAF